MKAIIKTGVLLFFTLSGYAQDNVELLKKQLFENDSTTFDRFLGHNEEGIYALFKKHVGDKTSKQASELELSFISKDPGYDVLFIIKYDEKLNELNRKSIKLEEREQIESIFLSEDNKIKLFTSITTLLRPNRSSTFYYRELESSFRNEEKKKQMFSDSIFLREAFYLSPDKKTSYLLFKDNGVINVMSFNEEVELSSHQKYKHKSFYYNNSKFDMPKTVFGSKKFVSNNGNVIILNKYELKKKQVKKYNKSKHYIEMLHFVNGEFLKYEVNHDNLPLDIIGNVNEKGNLLLSTLYSHSNEFVEGILLSKINLDMPNSMSLKEVSLDAEMLSKKWPVMRAFAHSLNMDMFSSDAGSVFLVHSLSWRDRTSYDAHSGKTRMLGKIYEGGNIMTVHITEDMTLSAQHIFEKKRHAYNDYTLGIFPFYKGSVLNLFLNEVGKTALSKESKKDASFMEKQSFWTNIMSFSPDGSNVNTSQHLNALNEKIVINHAKTMVLSDNRFVVFGNYDEGAQYIGILTIK